MASKTVFHLLVKMKIFLILVAALSFVACLGSPTGYQRETFENGRNSNNQQVTQTLVPEELKASREQQYQASRTNNQPTRQEYRRFGKNALPQSSQVDNSAAGFSTNERKPAQNQNSEIQATFTTKTQVSQFPPVSETPVQKSIFRNQDLRSDSQFAYSPVSQVQTTLSSQETLRSGIENADEPSVHNQGLPPKGTPFPMKRRSEIQSGMYQNFGTSFPRDQEQLSQAEEASFQNQNNFRSPVEDQRFQTQQTFYQNVAREDHGASQGQHPFSQRSLAKPDQITQRPQEQVNQYQKPSQEQVNQYQKPSPQSEQSAGPVSPFERDSFFNQGQIAFDSRRISSASPVNQPLEQASGDKRYLSSSSQFPRNQQNEKSQNRQSNGVKSNIHSEENKHSQTDNRQQNVGNTHEDRQGRFHNTEQNQPGRFRSTEQNQPGRFHSTEQNQPGRFHSTEQNQPALTMPHFQQNTTPVLLSGTKSAPAVPVMIYKTGSAASPHAVVLGRDLNVLNKASVSQHLQTPFTQYTYTHPL